MPVTTLTNQNRIDKFTEANNFLNVYLIKFMIGFINKNIMFRRSLNNRLIETPLHSKTFIIGTCFDVFSSFVVGTFPFSIRFLVRGVQQFLV